MTRAADVKLMRLDGQVNVLDLTATPLTTATTGDWVRCSNKVGFIHMKLAGTGPAATFTIEGSNDSTSTTGATIGTAATMTGVSDYGYTIETGAVFIRVNCSAISGTGASLTGTEAFT